MEDGVRSSGGVYRDGVEDLREETAGRPALEGKYRNLKTQLRQLDAVKSHKQLKLARVERFLDEVFAYCKASKDLSQETERLHVLKTFVGMMEGFLTGTAPYSIGNFEIIVKILCEKSRIAYLPVIQELIGSSARLSTLAAVVGDCEVEAEVFKTLMKYAREEPGKLDLAHAWSGLFRKERVKIAGMPALPETHDDKWRVNPMRLVPTALPRYIDTKKFQAFDTTVSAVVEAVGTSEVVIQNPRISVLEGLKSLRFSRQMFIHFGMLNYTQWNTLYEGEKEYDSMHIDELWKYCLVLLQNPGFSDTHGILIMRQLWRGLEKDPERLGFLQEKIAEIRTSGKLCDQVVYQYFVLNRYGLTPEEVDVVLNNAKVLKADGVAVLQNLRTHLKSEERLEPTQKLDKPEVVRLHEFVDVIAAMPESTSDTKTDKKHLLIEITNTFKEIRWGADYCKISPGCLAYVAENIADAGDVDSMKAVVCVYGNFSSPEGLDEFVKRVRKLPEDARKGLVISLCNDFVQAGTVNSRVVNTMLAVAEKCGASGLKLMSLGKGYWSKYQNAEGPKFEVETDQLDLLEQTIIGEGKDTESHLAHIQLLATKYAHHSTSPAWLAQYVDALEHGREPVVRMHSKNRFNVGLSADAEWQFLSQRFGESEQSGEYLTRLSSAPYQSALSKMHDESDRAVIYADLFGGQAYAACVEVCPTALAYIDLLYEKAKQAFDAENAVYQVLLKERNVGGVQGAVRRLIGKVYKPDEQPLPVVRNMSEFMLHEMHAFAARLSDRIKDATGPEMKKTICKRMADISGSCGADSELFDYFLSIADQDIFDAMVATRESLWQGNNEQRERVAEAFTKYPALRGLDILYGDVEIFEHMYAMCQKENGTAAYEWLTNDGALAPCNKVVGGSDIAAYKLGITQLVDTYTRLSTNNDLQEGDRRAFQAALLKVPSILKDYCLSDHNHRYVRLGPGDLNKVILWLEEKPVRWGYLFVNDKFSKEKKLSLSGFVKGLINQEFSSAGKNPNWLDRALNRLDIDGPHIPLVSGPVLWA